MLSIGATTRIFFAAGATDMRKGFDGLQGLVLNVLKQDPLAGHLRRATTRDGFRTQRATRTYSRSMEGD